MLDEILGKVKSEIGGDLLSKFNLTEEKKDKAFNLTGESIMEAVSGAQSGGMLDGVMNLFSSNDNDQKGNSMMDSIGSSLVGKFSQNLGLGGAEAGSMKDMILGKVMSMFGSKLGSSFELTDLLSMVSGGSDSKSGGMGDMLGKVTGLFK